MKKTQTAMVMEYITANPGATYREVIEATKCTTSTVNALLGQQHRRGKLIRRGEKGEYRYSIQPGCEVSGWIPEKRAPFEPGFGCANPLTRLFNACLAGVRA